jgi:hypothetical protein
MNQDDTKSALSFTPPPRAAAVSGIIFAILALIGFGFVRYAVPADINLPGNWLLEPHHRRLVELALTLVPFAGIALLWFLGVLRNRLGEQEDRFFATLFLGSGLMFIAALFVGAAVMKGLIEALEAGSIRSETYYFGRSLSDTLFNLFAIKMAGVFIFSTCTLGLRTRIFPRWIALLGYACAITMLVVIANWRWVTLVFPIWMLLVGAYILFEDLRH